MTPKQVLAFYGTQQGIADAADVGQPAVAAWFKRDAIPALRQLILAASSDGKLKPSRSVADRVRRASARARRSA